jgi:hypothetical protein
MGRETRRQGWWHEAGLRTRRRSLPSRFPPVKPPTGCTPHYSIYPSSQPHLRSPLLAMIEQQNLDRTLWGAVVACGFAPSTLTRSHINQSTVIQTPARGRGTCIRNTQSGSSVATAAQLQCNAQCGA